MYLRMSRYGRNKYTQNLFLFPLIHFFYFHFFIKKLTKTIGVKGFICRNNFFIKVEIEKYNIWALYTIRIWILCRLKNGINLLVNPSE